MKYYKNQQVSVEHNIYFVMKNQQLQVSAFK